MAKLCLLALLVLSTLTTNSSANTLRVERDACDDKTEELEACRLGAYEEYKEAFAAGDDGRPDWLARKSCNYMTKTIEECSEGMVGECMTEEEVNEMKDHQLKGILEQLSATINEWDSQKCPAMKAHLDRTNAAEDEEETPEGVDSAAQEKEEEKEEDKEEEGEEDKEEEEGIDTGASEDTPDTSEDETPEGEDGGDGEDSGDQGDEGETNDEGGDKDNGDESSEGPESGSEAATASLSLVLILYKICSA